jgi:hypothetical protein
MNKPLFFNDFFNPPPIPHKLVVSGKQVEVVNLTRTEIEGRGKGTADDPFRRIVQYWDFDGNLVFEEDPERI